MLSLFSACFFLFPVEKRTSLMDVAALACAVPPDVTSSSTITRVTLTSRSCGYSHNHMRLLPLEDQNTGFRDLALCVRPYNFTKDITKVSVARFLEYWRFMGIQDIFLYHSAIFDDKLREFLQNYEQESEKLLTTMDWSAINKMAELPVSSEAAANHCVMSRMTSHRFVMVTSFPELPLFPNSKFTTFDQLIRDQEFIAKTRQFSGFRITGSHENYQSMILTSRDMLALAANHFIPLSGRASYKILHPFDVTMVAMDTLWGYGIRTDSDGTNHDYMEGFNEAKLAVDAAAMQKLKTKTWSKEENEAVVVMRCLVSLVPPYFSVHRWLPCTWTGFCLFCG